jgi:hypothetical protein
MSKFILVITLFYSGLLYGQQPLSLDDALAIALDRSVTAKIAEKQIEIAEANNIV